MLLEGHLYIRFLSSPQGQPCYFCVVRVAQKSPCVVLHVGHMEGTPHSLQLETASFLSHSLGQLRGVVVDRGARGRGKAVPGKKKKKLPVRSKPILTVIGKQLQKFMVRYTQTDGHMEGRMDGVLKCVRSTYIHDRWDVSL